MHTHHASAEAVLAAGGDLFSLAGAPLPRAAPALGPPGTQATPGTSAPATPAAGAPATPGAGTPSGSGSGHGGIPTGGSGSGPGGPRGVSLADEARTRYLNYAVSVITSRALPDVRDGLKPVQRRILYGMWHDMGLTHEARYQKCAQAVGLIMGTYHPHGDSAIYEALVRMAQDFSLRYPLVDGHGNFGSLDGDNAAAYRYTECRLQPLASLLLSELGKGTVGFRPTYDGSHQEPIVVPARFPQLLANGSTGIAVGMATNIPPHNLGELCAACDALIEDATLETKDLLKHVKGPDFPTGGQILNSKAELREIYETGSGSVRVRGEYKVEDLPRGAQQIVVTSIPYAVNKGNLVAKIGELVAERKLAQLTDVRDESTTDVRIVLELKRDASAELVMAYLYKHTALQTNFAVNLTCLVPAEPKGRAEGATAGVPLVRGTDVPEVGAPERLDLKKMLRHFLDFRFEVVTRRLTHDLSGLQQRLHVLSGFEKVYDALDEMLKIIRKSDGKADAAVKLIKRFALDEEQVEAILEMKVYRLARLEILVIQKEAEEKRAEVKRLDRLLASEKLRWNLVRDELREVAEQHKDRRRTRIGGGGEEVEYSEEAFIADEDAHVVITRDGWVKRVREVKDPAQSRVREGDSVAFVLAGSLKANLVLFSTRGAAYVTRFNDIPPSTGYGDPVQKLFKFDDGERVLFALSLDPRLARPEKLLALSKKGFGLRFSLAAHTEVSTRAGRLYARPVEGDELVFLAEVREEQLVGVVSKHGHALICEAREINELAGAGKGVTVIKLDDDDQVIAAKVADEKRGDNQAIALASAKGKQVGIELRRGEVVARGGRGRELVRKDTLAAPAMPIVFVPLPQPPAVEGKQEKLLK